MKYISYLLCLCLITACVSSTPRDSLIKGSPCEPPCWNGLTPGETTFDDASQIVRELTNVDQTKIDELTYSGEVFDKWIRFYIVRDDLLTKKQTIGALYFIDDRLAVILLLANVGGTFGEMVEMVGEPEVILSLQHPEDIQIKAILPSKGISFDSYARSDQFSAETRIDNVMLFDPSQYEQLLDAAMFSLGKYGAADTKKMMHPWRGYGSIEELYPLVFPDFK
ncbi:MAG TPA: hypothetical protein VJ785_10795 [Anaerolineales bacterium]|nr:hypothetical protein [Anaerolineales bacterium]